MKVRTKNQQDCTSLAGRCGYSFHSNLKVVSRTSDKDIEELVLSGIMCSS